MNDILTKRRISHDEAQEALQRLVNSHFRREPHARIGIPARPDYDDDLVMSAYIRQQRALSKPEKDGWEPPTNLPYGWEYQEATNCVICGGCGFRFGAEHPDGDGQWSCPNCGDGRPLPAPPAREGE